MNTKLINCLAFLFCFFMCEFTESKTVRAKNHIDALYKIQKKQYGFFYKSEIEDRNYHRKHFLLGREEWEFFGSKEDTIYVCVHLSSSSRDEYIISSKLIYATHSRCRSLSWEIYSLEEKIFPWYFVEEKNIPDILNINYVRNWDVDTFKRWSSTDLNDYASVKAYRIIRKSKRKYEYEFYHYYDNYDIENDPFGWDM